MGKLDTVCSSMSRNRGSPNHPSAELCFSWRCEGHPPLLQVVEDLLNFLEADPNEMHDLPAWHYVDVQRPAGSQITLRDMLTHCYDLRSAPRDLENPAWIYMRLPVDTCNHVTKAYSAMRWASPCLICCIINDALNLVLVSHFQPGSTWLKAFASLKHNVDDVSFPMTAGHPKWSWCSCCSSARPLRGS